MACVAHPSIHETRRCTDCEARWCSECVALLRTGNRASCPRCGHEVIRAAPDLSAKEQVRDAVQRVASMEGITTALGFAVCFMVSRWMPIFIAAYAAAFVGYYFTIIAHVGTCEAGLPGPSDAVDDLSQILDQVMRGVVCLIAATLPLLLWFAAKHDAPSPELALLLIVVGQLYLPAALLSITLSNKALAALWPPSWFAVVRRSPAAYARFAGVWMVSVVIGIAIVEATRPLTAFALGALVAGTIWNLFGFAQASLVGLYLRQRDDAFGLHDDPT